MRPRMSWCVTDLSFERNRWEPLMKIITVGALASALALASSPGHTLSFDFSFSNTSSDPGHVNGTVTGLVGGLTDNTTSAATHVTVESYPAGIGSEPPAPFDVSPGVSAQNIFTVANGSITSAFFFSAPMSFCLSLGSLPPGAGCLGGAFFGFQTEGFVQGPVSFTPA